MFCEFKEAGCQVLYPPHINTTFVVASSQKS